VRFKITFWVEPEAETAPDNLDPAFRKQELGKPNGKEVFDPGLKEGKVGFFCSDCSTIMWSSIQLWCDKCIIKKTNSSN